MADPSPQSKRLLWFLVLEAGYSLDTFSCHNAGCDLSDMGDMVHTCKCEGTQRYVHNLDTAVVEEEQEQEGREAGSCMRRCQVDHTPASTHVRIGEGMKRGWQNPAQSSLNIFKTLYITCGHRERESPRRYLG